MNKLNPRFKIVFKEQGEIKRVKFCYNRWLNLELHFDKLETAYKEGSTHSSYFGEDWFVDCVDGCIKFELKPPLARHKSFTISWSIWESLRSTMSKIAEFHDELQKEDACLFSPSHQNQMGFLKCANCNESFREWI